MSVRYASTVASGEDNDEGACTAFTARSLLSVIHGSGDLSPERVLPLVRGRFGRPYLYAAVCGTTQELLAPDLPEGAVAVCEEQTAGRGRHGRRWHAPPYAAILCSVLLRPPATAERPQLGLVAAVATAETVEAATGRRASIKWPNDVLLDAGKVAGILAEIRDGAVVLGIGLNVNQRPGELPQDRFPRALSLLAADGVHRDRAPLLADLLTRLERRYDGWRDRGFGAVHGDFEQRDWLRGRRVEVGGVAGVGAGIDDRGRLRLETADGAQAVVSGEVTLAGA